MCFFLYIKNHGIPENLLKTKSGEWIQATPVNGTVLDLVADCCPSGVIDYIEQHFIDSLFRMMKLKDDVEEVPSFILLFPTMTSQWSHSIARAQRLQ
ncbi:uncharacterized protein LOC143243997 isoform X2 [Tachypleus tridentatus]|uniref:uncharacterized protein LOC143243997 isoform X2 n=1 Tax=Tachypleus tridentatus TaxID=6853 RepID=UPI003FD53F6C